MTRVILPDPLAEFHRANVELAIHSRAESDWHDFKQFASNDGKIDEFLKDFAALANTPGGPYQGHGYVIIGVVDRTFELVGLQGKDAMVTVDERTNQLSNMIARGIAPYLEFSVFDLVVDEKRVQCIAIPEAPGSWHLVTSDKNSGFWIRRGFASARPTYQDFEDHQRRQLQRELTPLREQIASLEIRLGTQRELLQDVQQQRDPLNESVAHLVTRQLQSPEHALLAKVRGELLTFRDEHIKAMVAVARFSPDRLLSLPDERTPERLAELQGLVECLEMLTRPVVETLARLIHANVTSDLIKLMVREIADVFTERTYGPQTHLAGITALRSYPAQLLFYGAATASFNGPDLTLLGIMLHHRRNASAPFSGTVRGPALASSLNLRGSLDQLLLLTSPESHHQATVERMERLLLQGDWVGSVLPVIDREKLFNRAEALLTLGYIAAAQGMGMRPPSPDPAWWRYTDADDTLLAAVIRLRLSNSQLLRAAPLAVVAAIFDEMDKPPQTLLQVQAADLILLDIQQPP